MRNGLAGRTVTVKVKYSDFQQITRRKSFSEPVASQSDLERMSLELLRPCFPPPRSVRLLGVTLSSLTAISEQSREQLAFGLTAQVIDATLPNSVGT